MQEIDQKICRLFADREVLADVSEIVEYVFDTAAPNNAPPFTEADVVAGGEGYCPNCGVSSDYLETEIIQPGAAQAKRDEDAPHDERWVCPWCGTGYPSQEEAEECCIGLEVARCTACGHSISIDDYDELTAGDINGVEQWLLVTPWLAKKLIEYGEPVIAPANIWGRHSSNDDWGEDDLIRSICREIGILQGQPHDWSKHFS